MYKKYYSRFLNALGGKLHFAAHSHHLWPDVSREAHIQYWDDSARMIDDKWGHIFDVVIPQTQKHIARILDLHDEKQIALAPNTHELVARLFSVFEKKPIKVLTTENEFHSFRRQLSRLEEAGIAQVTRVPSSQVDTLKQKLKSETFDLLFFSHVFFDSGIALSNDELASIVKVAPKETIVCIDGYHAFGAIPVSLSALEGRVFYLGGGYKYAQGGEGACFMVVPKGEWRPMNTGWFAEIESLNAKQTSKVTYPKNASAFWGSTQDPSGFYRFNAVWSLFENEGIHVEKIRQHVGALQELFISQLIDTSLSEIKFMNPNRDARGNFLTFDFGDAQKAADFSIFMKTKGITTDYRGSRLRIGFGLYHDENDVNQLIKAL